MPTKGDPMTGNTRVRSRDTAAHQQAVKLAVADVASFLTENLGTTLTGLIAGVNARSVQRYAKGETQPGAAVEARLRTAFQVFNLVQSVETPHTVRAWFIGMNPQLDDTSPVEALAAGQAREVLTAARAFVSGG